LARRPQTLSLRALSVPVNPPVYPLGRSRTAPGNPLRDEARLSERIHRIGVDVVVVKRYSVPILGKYLVIIANPASPKMHAQFSVLQPSHNLRSDLKPTTQSAPMDLIGGHFSA
jgi:hypothetical protein